MQVSFQSCHLLTTIHWASEGEKKKLELKNRIKQIYK